DSRRDEHAFFQKKILAIGVAEIALLEAQALSSARTREAEGFHGLEPAVGLSQVSARVHEDRAAHGARDTREELKAGPPLPGGPAENGGHGDADARPDKKAAHVPAHDLDVPVQTPGFDDHSIESRVRNQ